MPLHEQTTLSHRDLFSERETARRRAVRAAAWRALELARAVFGPGVSIRLRPTGGRGWLGGLLHLDVPFRDPADPPGYRGPEGGGPEDVFMACAGADPLLSRIHLVFVFNPRPEAASGTAPSGAVAGASPAPAR